MSAMELYAHVWQMYHDSWNPPRLKEKWERATGYSFQILVAQWMGREPKRNKEISRERRKDQSKSDLL